MTTATVDLDALRLDRRFEAVVLVGDGGDPDAAAVTALREAGVEVVTLGPGSTGENLGAAFRRERDRLWRLGIGLGATVVVAGGLGPLADDLDPLLDDDLLTATLATVGLDPRLLPPGVVALPGGRSGIAALLGDQAARRRRHDVPTSVAEPGWGLAVEGYDPERERVHESLLAVVDGHIGLSGAPLLATDEAERWVVANGAYVGTGPETHLVTAPAVFHLPDPLPDDARVSRLLDLRSGLVYEEVAGGGDRVRSVRFTSLARPGTAVVRAFSTRPATAAPLLLPPQSDPILDEGEADGASWMRVAAGDGGVVAAATQHVTEVPGGHAVDRFAAYETGTEALPDPAPAVRRAVRAAADGFETLLAEQRRACASRWEEADITIEGDDRLQLATRFALFHLMGTAPDSGEAAVGARGLTGEGYRGHVFWDADTFVLPFLAATHPAAARAMLEYRLRRLPAALAIARESGYAGARFPWESARTGRDVTPTSARDRTGRLVPIRTGLLEDHIVAQVPWAAACYVDWTGDLEFAAGPGLTLLVETARYWASRIRVEADGTAHIYGVIGPDEYHEPVDDNAFTNVIARWNLRRAAAAVESAPVDAGVPDTELLRWRELAAALVDGWDPDTGVYEQFAGFGRLEPLIIAEVAPRRPIAADLLLGAGRVHGAQVLKQADVLMLHHLVPDEVVPGTLEANLRYYEPRTAHGSSLSPSIHAALFARVRDYEHALEALDIASRIDTDDLTGTTAGGLHVATMGGLWQAFAYGFTGLRPVEGRLAVDPRLPRSWSALEVRVRFRGRRVAVRTERAAVSITADAPVGISLDGRPYTAGPRGLSFRRTGPTWEAIP